MSKHKLCTLHSFSIRFWIFNFNPFTLLIKNRLSLWAKEWFATKHSTRYMCVSQFTTQHSFTPEWRWSEVHDYQLLLEWTRVIYLANGGLSKLTEFITVEFGPPARGCPGGPITCGCGAGGPGNEHVFPLTQFESFHFFRQATIKMLGEEITDS